MKKPGRKSAASLEVVSNHGVHRIERVRPPEWLNESAAQEFRRLVSVCAADHFRPGDEALLARYVQVIIAGNQAQDADEFLKFAKVQSAMAIRLRLCPSARTRPETAGRKPGNGGRSWESEIDG